MTQADEPRMVIPFDRLPPGFAERVADPPPEAAVPRPAATVVLMRDAGAAPELLLMRRHRRSGFVPGAYVFPGGIVDAGDHDPSLRAMLRPPPHEPPPAFWIAAVRELFEETGVLLARGADDSACADARDDAVAAERAALLDGARDLRAVLDALGARIDIGRMVYCAHWITPIAEARRYDTRFFMAALPPGREASADAREMEDAVWVTADEAVDGFRSGSLPMVFPTIKTIQRLVGYRTLDELLDAFRGTTVPPVLPRLVRTDGGIGIVVDETEKDEARE